MTTTNIGAKSSKEHMLGKNIWQPCIKSVIISQPLLYVKKSISTSKRHSEHLFAGQNTQQAEAPMSKTQTVCDSKTFWEEGLEGSSIFFGFSAFPLGFGVMVYLSL